MKKFLLIIVSVLSFGISFSQVKIKSSDKISVTKEGIYAKNEKIIETLISEMEDMTNADVKKNTGMIKFAKPKNVDIYPFSESVFEKLGNDMVYRQKIIA